MKTKKRGRPKKYSDGLTKQRRWQLRHAVQYKKAKHEQYEERVLPLKIKKALKFLKENGYDCSKMKSL